MNKKIYFKNVYVYDLLKHKDNRGFFVELFNYKNLKKKLNIDFNCLQTSLAYSKKKVFRGFHVQNIKPIEQLISVIYGSVYYYFFDIRKNSKTFGKHHKVLLSSKNQRMLYLPKGFAGGYYCVDKENIVLYHQNEFFYKKFDSGFNIRSKSINIKITKKIISSKKDLNLKNFSEFSNFVMK
jgi:dTDP-4-dehydrorhamnose 3,5-epimerase